MNEKKLLSYFELSSYNKIEKEDVTLVTLSVTLVTDKMHAL